MEVRDLQQLGLSMREPALGTWDNSGGCGRSCKRCVSPAITALLDVTAERRRPARHDAHNALLDAAETPGETLRRGGGDGCDGISAITMRPSRPQLYLIW
ncbi:hypothetical protein JIR23_06450 [Bradyrhizobium diazoefficiens]|nr:hypothetical protein JIR23_06450 [Bradyrhizobium diazoefficiens]